MYIQGDVFLQLQLSSIQQQPLMLLKFKNPLPETQIAAVRMDSSLIRHIPNPCSVAQSTSVHDDGDNIRYINNPSFEAQLAAVSNKPSSIRFIKDPHPEIQLYVVGQDAELIRYIENPPLEVQLEVFGSNPQSLRFVANVHESIDFDIDYEFSHINKQKQFVEENSTNIRFIKDPYPEIQMLAIRPRKGTITLFKDVQDGSISVVKHLYSRVHDDILGYIANPCLDAQLEAVRQSPLSISCIKNPLPEVQLEVLKGDAFAIRYIANPCLDAQLYFLSYLINERSGIFSYVKEQILKVSLPSKNYYQPLIELRGKFPDIDYLTLVSITSDNAKLASLLEFILKVSSLSEDDTVLVKLLKDSLST